MEKYLTPKAELNFCQHKLRNKQLRSYNSVQMAFGIPPDKIFAGSQTNVLVCANCGGSHGISQETYLQTMERFGVVRRIVLALEWSFALVEFETAESAAAAKKALHFSELDELKGRAVFVEFAQPELLTRCKAESVAVRGKGSMSLVDAVSLHRLAPQLSPTWPDIAALLTSSPSVRIPADSTTAPAGLLLIRDFVSEDEQHSLLQFLNSRPWAEHKLRHVQHYGYVFNYEVNNVSSSDSKGVFPSAFDVVVRRLASFLDDDGDGLCVQAQTETTDSKDRDKHACTCGQAHVGESAAGGDESASSTATANACFGPFAPEQLTVNKYEPGHGIPAHIDTHSAFTHIICSLSLCAPIVMELRQQTSRAATASASATATATTTTEERKAEPAPGSAPTSSAVTPSLYTKGLATFSLCLPPRSLLLMKGEARYAWTHGIANRKNDRVDGKLVERSMRISLTFRRLRRGKCTCGFARVCDTERSAPRPASTTA